MHPDGMYAMDASKVLDEIEAENPDIKKDIEEEEAKSKGESSDS